MTADPSPHAKRLVVRNTLISFGAQVIGTPLSIAVTAITARFLGADDFGELYLALTFTLLGFQFVEFGHGQVLTGNIARDRSKAGELLGASITWRVAATILVFIVLECLTYPLGYSDHFRTVLALATLQCFMQTLSTACQDSIRGFERTDIGALGQIGTQLLNLALVVPALWIGGGILSVLIAQTIGSALILLLVLHAARRIEFGRLAVSYATIKSLVVQGAPFLAFSLALAIQPSVDAMFLSKLCPPEVVGWHAVARRLLGALLIPASLVISALYPTLSRLFITDRAEYDATTRGALHVTSLLAVPIALSCALYPDIGIQIFSKEAFAQAQQNLVLVSFALYLMYITMALGIALLAAKRQKIWAAVQSICVVVSCLLDPALIAWFQEHHGNGGLGIAAAAGISEVLMVAAAIYLSPRGVFSKDIGMALLRTLAAGVAMGLVALLLRRFSSWIAAPFALSTYVVALWALGGLQRDQLALFLSAFRRKRVEI